MRIQSFFILALIVTNTLGLSIPGFKVKKNLMRDIKAPTPPSFPYQFEGKYMEWLNFFHDGGNSSTNMTELGYLYFDANNNQSRVQTVLTDINGNLVNVIGLEEISTKTQDIHAYQNADNEEENIICHYYSGTGAMVDLPSTLTFIGAYFLIPMYITSLDYSNELFFTNFLWGIRSIDLYIGFDIHTSSSVSIGYDSFTKSLTMVSAVSSEFEYTIIFSDIRTGQPDASNFVKPESYQCSYGDDHNDHSQLLKHRRNIKKFPFRLLHH
jgi:hypothetical protein